MTCSWPFTISYSSLRSQFNSPDSRDTHWWILTNSVSSSQHSYSIICYYSYLVLHVFLLYIVPNYFMFVYSILSIFSRAWTMLFSITPRSSILQLHRPEFSPKHELTGKWNFPEGLQTRTQPSQHLILALWYSE